MTAVANSAFTAAQFNTHIRDNLLETAPAKATTAGGIFVATAANAIAQRIIAGATVLTSQTTTSTTYTDLATVGPAVTVTTGTQALVFINSAVANDTVGSRTRASFAVSGASAISAADISAIARDADAANRIVRAASVYLQTGLTPGSNIFTMKYRVTGNTGEFFDRHIVVMPL